jgi:V/A-type H+-transporting ATPase subunit I
VPDLRDRVRRVTAGQALIEVREATREEIEQGEVPTYTPHYGALRPFARLVSGYGSADYQEIEPTLLFAASFLLMFGIMFGDMGHGMCLLLGGLAAYIWGGQRVTRDVGYVIAAAGLSGALFGTFFQGTMFGWSLADLGFPWTLGFEPVRLHGAGSGAGSHVIRYLFISLLLGVVLLSLGMVLNIINRLRTGDVMGAVLQRFGLVGLLFYWGALAVAARAMLSGVGSISVWFMLGALAVPFLLVMAGDPLQHLLVHGSENMGPSSFTGIVHGLESAMTFFANTLSFLRVAAFALSHAGLSFTIFVLMDLVSSLPGGTILEWFVFAVGTVLVIGLEGLIVAIQIFRLEYYEFFTKFFRADGRQFQPFQLTRGG